MKNEFRFKIPDIVKQQIRDGYGHLRISYSPEIDERHPDKDIAIYVNIILRDIHNVSQEMDWDSGMPISFEDWFTAESKDREIKGCV